MPKVHEEQCELFIEQEIEEALKEGKTPYQVGKEIAEFVEKTFRRIVKPKTIAKRMERKISDIVATDLTTENDEEIEENQEIKWGGKREGAGRPPIFRVIERVDTIATKWTGDQESYTPEIYIEAAREVMGSIDLDPASNEMAQKIVKATIYYTKENNGLNKPWIGNIFLNPPYSQPEIKHFIDKLLSELSDGQQAILLTNNNTDTTWFHKAAQKARWVCFTKGRINFYKADGHTATSPTNGQSFFYFGNRYSFVEVFSDFGLIMRCV